MSKELIVKCESIIKHHVVNNQITYQKLNAELDKNKNFKSTTQRANAVQYLKEKGIEVIYDNKSKEIFTLDDHEYLKYLIEMANNNNTKIIDMSLLKVHFSNADKYNQAIKHLVSIGYKVTLNEFESDELYEDSYNEEQTEETVEDTSSNYLSTDGVRQYLAEIGKYSLLSAEDEYKIFTEYRRTNDPALKETITKSNLKLVVSIAKYYVNKCDLGFLDIIQHGNLGLLIAIDRFEPERGFKFSTYATWWIRQSILRGIGNDCRTIRLPIHAAEQANKNRKSRNELKKILNRAPTNEELLDYINENKLYVNSITYIDMETMLLFESYYDNNLVSLNKPVGEDEDSDSCLMDFIETTDAIPEIVVEKRQLQEDVRNAMREALAKYNSFNQREIDVINLRFGIYDNQPRTLQEVAEIFGVTRERIRQIEAKVIKKLRRSATFRNKTKNYIDSEY